MEPPLKKRASRPQYISPPQGVLAGSETPFPQKPDPQNRWALLANRIPWDKIASVYNRQMSGSAEGRPPLSARLVIGALFIKHINNRDDREAILQIRGNMYLQCFVGYASFTADAIFDPSLFVEIRKGMGDVQLDTIDEEIVKLHLATAAHKATALDRPINKGKDRPTGKPLNEGPKPDALHEAVTANTGATVGNAVAIAHQGRMVTDATACPQDIAFPTDVNLPNDAREKPEHPIDVLYSLSAYEKEKPRTYRKNAREACLAIARNENNTKPSVKPWANNPATWNETSRAYTPSLTHTT